MAAELEQPLLHIAALLPHSAQGDQISTRAIFDTIQPVCDALSAVHRPSGGCRFLAIPRSSLAETASIDEIGSGELGPQASALAEVAVTHIIDSCLLASSVQRAEEGSGSSSGRSKKSPRGASKGAGKSKKAAKSKGKNTKDSQSELDLAVLGGLSSMEEPWGTPNVFVVFGNYPMSALEHSALMQALAAAKWPMVQSIEQGSVDSSAPFQYVPPVLPARVLSSALLLQRQGAARSFPLPTAQAQDAAADASPRSGRKSPKSKKGKAPLADTEAAAAQLSAHLAGLGSTSLCTAGALAEAVGGPAHCIMPIQVHSDVAADTDATAVPGLPALLSPAQVAASVARALYALAGDSRAYAEWIAHTDVQDLLPPLPLSGSARKWQRLSEPLLQMYTQECSVLEAAAGGGALLQSPAGILHAMVQAVAAVGIAEPRATPRVVPTLASVGGIALPASPRDGTLLSSGGDPPLTAVTAVEAPWGDMDAVWSSASHPPLEGARPLVAAGSVLSVADSSAASSALHGMAHAAGSDTTPVALTVFKPALNALLPADIASGAVNATDAYDASATLAERETLMLHAGMAPGGDAARVALERQDILQAAAQALNAVESASTAVEFGFADSLLDGPAAPEAADRDEDGDSYDGAAGLDMLASTTSGRDSPVPDEYQGDATSAGAASPTLQADSPPLPPSSVSLGSIAFEPVDSMGQQFSSLNLGSGDLRAAGGFEGSVVQSSLPSCRVTAGALLPPAAAKLAHTWDLSDRRHVLPMTATELAQRALSALSSTPGAAAYTHPLPRHGAAVLAVHAPTPRKRHSQRTVLAAGSLQGTSVLPSFSEWRRSVLPGLSIPGVHAADAAADTSAEGTAAGGDEAWTPAKRPSSPIDSDIPRCPIETAVQLSALELDAAVAAAVKVFPRGKHEGNVQHESAAQEANQRLQGLAGHRVEQLFPSDGSVVTVTSVGAARVAATAASDAEQPAWCWGVRGRSMHVALPDGPSLRVAPDDPPALRKLRLDDDAGAVQHRPFSTGRCSAVLSLPAAGEALHMGMAGNTQLLLSTQPPSLPAGWHLGSQGAYKLDTWASKAGVQLQQPPSQEHLRKAAAKIQTLKPDGYGTVQACVRCGPLEVDVSSAGTVRQRLAQQRPAWPQWMHESARSHDCLSGEVIRTLEAVAGTGEEPSQQQDQQPLQHALRADGSTRWSVPAASTANTQLPTTAVKHLECFADGRRTVSWQGVPVSALAALEAGAAAVVRTAELSGGGVSVQQALATLSADQVVTISWDITPVDVMSTLDAASGAVVTVRFEACPLSDPSALEAALIAQVAAARIAARPTPVFKKARDVMLLGELSTGLQREHDAERLGAMGGPWSGASSSSTCTEAKAQESLDAQLGRRHALQLWGHPHLAPLVADVAAHPLPAAQELTPQTADADVFGANGSWEGIGALGKVVTVHYPDGTVLAQHSDGSAIVVEPPVAPADTEGSALPQQHITVACQGMATVESDRHLHAAFEGHARGEPVSIVSTGVQTRLVVTCPDDTMVAADYDCSITALWNGRVRVHTSDGRVVLLHDGGALQYRGPHADRGEDVLGPGVAQAHADSDDDDDETAAMAAPSPRGAATAALGVAPLALGGLHLESKRRDSGAQATPRDHDIDVFHVQLETGELRMRDSNANVFTVDKRGGCIAELAGAIDVGDGSTLYPDLVNPRPPRLFVARSDGSAYELLTSEEWGALTRRAKHAFDVAAHLAHGLAGEAPSELLAGLPSGSASRGPVGTALTSGRHEGQLLHSAPIPQGRGAAARQDPSALPPPAVEGAVVSAHVPSELAAPTALPSQGAAPPVPPPGAAGGDTPLAQALHGIVQYTFVQRRHSSDATGGPLHSVGVVHSGSRMQVRACTRGWIQPTDAFVQGMLRRNRPQRTDVFGAAAMPAPAVFEARSDATAVAHMHQSQREVFLAGTGGTTGFLGASTLGSTAASGMQMSSSSSRSRCVALMPELVSAPSSGLPALHCTGASFAVTVFPELGQSWQQAVHAAESNVAAWREKVLAEKYQFKVFDDRAQEAVASELHLARAALRLRALSRARAKKLRKSERRARKAARRERAESGASMSIPGVPSIPGSPGASPGGHSGFGTPHPAAHDGFTFHDGDSADGSGSESDDDMLAAASMHDSPDKAPPNPGLQLSLAPEGLGGTAASAMPADAQQHMRNKALKYA